MLTFSYTARDPSTGNKVKSEIQAENEKAASKMISQQGLSPIEITLKKGGDSGIGRFRNRIRTKDKILFSRQLSTLINAGLPLLQSLRNVAEQTQSKPFQVIINKVIADVEAGSALSAAFAKHPQAFNRIYVSMVAAGEVSGTLDKSLERLATQQEKDAELINKVRGAMVYPAIVLVVMSLVVAFMLVKVLPQVEELYDGLGGGQLPIVTRLLLGVSDFITGFWWLILIILGVAIFFMSRWARTGPGKQFVDGVKMKAPAIGPLFMKMYMARFARTGTTLVASGVPLIQMLEITADSINNVHIEAALTQAIDKVRAGKALSEAIDNNPNFLDLVPDMLRIGEQSGAIEEMMAKTADYYEKEVDNEVKAISTIIEPVMMILLGIFAFIIVAAILLPVYGLAGKDVIK